LPGEREIREASEVLRKAELRNVEILPLYARLSVPEQQKIFSPNRSSRRRIIISSKVERSLNRLYVPFENSNVNNDLNIAS
jgi:ATP-dependent helicase HrpA